MSGLGFVAVLWILLQNVGAIGWLLGAGGAAVVGYIVLTSFTTLDRAERQNIFAALSMMALSVLFMGTWFLAQAAGNFTSSLIARATSIGADSTGSTDRVLEVYTNVGALAVAIGVVLILTSRQRRGNLTGPQ